MVGLQQHWRQDGAAALGAGGQDLVRLTELPGARRYPGTTGLYHFAILLPSRRELARAIARLIALRYPNAPTDHIMTKTTYLDDPEGQNIELYADTPEDGTWEIAEGQPFARRADGSPSDGREPLDVVALLEHLQPDDRLEAPMPPETRMGHFHLYVADLQTSMDFYHGVLGLDDMGMGGSFRMGMVSAGRYHHHIGFNTWLGEGSPPAPPEALGLRHISLVLPGERELEQLLERLTAARVPVEETPEGILVRDPSHNAIVLTDDP